MEPIEEAFNCVVVHDDEANLLKVTKFYEEIFSQNISSLTITQKEKLVTQILLRSASQTNLSQLNFLMDALHKLVTKGFITAQMLCEHILNCDKLDYSNQNFWIVSFQIIRKIISDVDYKGVRKIMKYCREKLQFFPENIRSGNSSQIQALYDVIEHIFNRNACLLPAYFIVTEIEKPESVQCHWVSIFNIYNLI